MNIRTGLIEAAARSSILLGDRAEDVIRIIISRQQPDGGFSGKGSDSDLYYTGFAMLSLMALEADFDTSSVIPYLESFGEGACLDLAHLAGLIRERVLVMDTPFHEEQQQAFIDQIERFRCADGAYHHLKGQQTGSAYGCFLAAGAYQDLALPIPAAKEMLGCIEFLHHAGGGYFNEQDIPAVSVPATAAALMVQRILTGSADAGGAIQWLLSCREPSGGFKVMPFAPVADLLSTAVALHVLSPLGVIPETLRQELMCFVDLLWKGHVGFCANPFDSISDTEYMFYGLLSLGHLSGHE